MAKKLLIIGGSRSLGYAITKAFVARGCNVCEMNRGSRPPENRNDFSDAVFLYGIATLRIFM